MFVLKKPSCHVTSRHVTSVSCVNAVTSNAINIITAAVVHWCYWTADI